MLSPISFLLLNLLIQGVSAALYRITSRQRERSRQLAAANFKKQKWRLGSAETVQEHAGKPEALSSSDQNSPTIDPVIMQKFGIGGRWRRTLLRPGFDPLSAVEETPIPSEKTVTVAPVNERQLETDRTILQNYGIGGRWRRNILRQHSSEGSPSEIAKSPNSNDPSASQQPPNKELAILGSVLAGGIGISAHSEHTKREKREERAQRAQRQRHMTLGEELALLYTAEEYRRTHTWWKEEFEKRESMMSREELLREYEVWRKMEEEAEEE